MGHTTIDLTKMTPDAVKSDVLSTLAASPLTIFPMLGAVGLMAFWFIFNASWVFTVLGGVAFVFGATYFCINFFLRFDVHRNKYFSKLREENERDARRALREIEDFLEEHDFNQGADQVTKLQNKMAGFERVLKKRFEEGEMAYARYHKVAEQVFITAIDNLQNVVVQLEAIDNIDTAYIQRRYEELEAICDEKDGLTDAQMAESATLAERFELVEKHETAVEGLLAMNETAMTELDKFASTVSTAKTEGRDVEQELQRAMDTLGKLSDEARKNWG